MKTSELIEILKRSVETHGDLDVKIESSYGEYGEADINCAVGTRASKPGDRFPLFTGDAYFLLSSDDRDARTSVSLHNGD